MNHSAGKVWAELMNFFNIWSVHYEVQKNIKIIIFCLLHLATVAALAVYFVELTKDMESADGGGSGFSNSIYYSLLKYLVLLIPTFNYSLAFMKFTQIRLTNIAADNPICKGLFKKKNSVILNLGMLVFIDGI